MPTTPRPSRAPLIPILRPSLLGTCLFVAAFTIALLQAARSNRPHELTAAPLVTLIQIGAVVALSIGGLRLKRMLRGRDEATVGPAHWALAIALPVMIALAALFLWAAADTAVQVLRS